jgi:hypothetical protein
MQVPDVAFPEVLRGEGPGAPKPDARVFAPELWPVSVWDGVWIVAGLALARVLSFLV